MNPTSSVDNATASRIRQEWQTMTTALKGKGDAYRAYGDTIEKSSYLMKENGHKEFHKRTVEAGDKVTYVSDPQGDDKSWVDGLE